MKAIENIDISWNPIIGLLFQEPLKTLNEKILPNISYQPDKDYILRVFQMPVTKIRVVILGQDPYPTPGDAIGYAFAVNSDRRIPQSLKIIKKEIENTKGIKHITGHPSWRTLEHWRSQGVFLINTSLTTETGKSKSHSKYWKMFIIRVISYLSDIQPCIWLLLGKDAKSFIPYLSARPVIVNDKYTVNSIFKINVDQFRHYVITASHPAAEVYQSNAGFLGKGVFYKINVILRNKNQKEIIW